MNEQTLRRSPVYKQKEQHRRCQPFITLLPLWTQTPQPKLSSWSLFSIKPWTSQWKQHGLLFICSHCLSQKDQTQYAFTILRQKRRSYQVLAGLLCFYFNQQWNIQQQQEANHIRLIIVNWGISGFLEGTICRTSHTQLQEAGCTSRFWYLHGVWNWFLWGIQTLWPEWGCMGRDERDEIQWTNWKYGQACSSFQITFNKDWNDGFYCRHILFQRNPPSRVTTEDYYAAKCTQKFGRLV